MIKNICIALLVAMTFASVGWAQQEQDQERVETRTYDVSDLLRAPANYPMPAPRPVNANTPAAADPFATNAPPPITADALIHLLEDTVAADTWRDNGGAVGATRALGNVLVITQTVAAHEQVRKLLEQLRADPAVATMLSVRGYWVRLDPAELAAIYAAAKPIGGGNATAMPELPDKFLDKDHLYFMGQTTCFNAQTVHVTGGRDFNYISDLTPVVASGAVAYDPTLGTIHSGVQLQVTPQIVPSGDFASVDLHSSVTEAAPGGAIPIEYPTTRNSVSPPPALAVERMNVITQQLHTTVRVPLHKKLLIGGMTLEPAGKDASPRQLYLVVEVDAVK